MLVLKCDSSLEQVIWCEMDVGDKNRNCENILNNFKTWFVWCIGKFKEVKELNWEEIKFLENKYKY